KAKIAKLRKVAKLYKEKIIAEKRVAREAAKVAREKKRAEKATECARKKEAYNREKTIQFIRKDKRKALQLSI
ncbi:hypothetical protein BU23DRAFT_456830, partial [Bimuria novae-zelandiae CBS 107.79]